MQSAKDQAHDVMDSASDLATQAKDRVQQFASSMAGEAKDKVQEYATMAADTAQDMGKELTNLVRRYPLQALLVGLGVGLLLGRVSRS